MCFLFLNTLTKISKGFIMDEKEFRKYLGLRIKELRTKKGLTQEELAEKINVGERNLSKIECGEIFFKLKTLLGLISALDTAPDELFNFNVLRDNEELKQILIKEISENKIDINLLYRIYRSIKY